MPSGANVTVQVNNPVTPKPASNNTTNKTTTPAKNTSTSKTSTPKSTEPKYKNEWRNGKWYGADGKSTYSGTLSWKSNSKGWWVEDSAGWYPQNQWQKIDGIWYYFKPDGYMASSEYYNGYWFNSNGSWDPQYKLSWKSNATGWWVEDISGWWPSNKWLKVDGDWYYFNGSGYMATSQYVDGYWLAANGVCQ
jgi:glucan-binding YG repeat protein